MINSSYFGLDVGEKTIGIALSSGFYAQPLQTVVFNNEDYHQAAKQVAKLIEDNYVGVVVIGLPKHMNNSVGISAERALLFQKLLQEMTEATCIMWDERLTSKEAERRMIESNVSRKKRKQRIDQMAAVIILQSYLDHSERK